jgi:cell division protein FtsL
VRDEGFEYAIRKDIRNNPIVREIDRGRYREMWRSVAIGLFLAGVLVFSAWRRLGLLSHGYDVGQLRAEITAVEAKNEEWRAEIVRLRNPSRIDMVARRELGMVTPALEDQGVIDRVVSSPPPPHSVVARR